MAIVKIGGGVPKQRTAFKVGDLVSVSTMGEHVRCIVTDHVHSGVEVVRLDTGKVSVVPALYVLLRLDSVTLINDLEVR